jgi:hypothetical protein
MVHDMTVVPHRDGSERWEVTVRQSGTVVGHLDV